MTMRRWLFLSPAVLFTVVAGYFFWGLNPDRDPRAVPSALIDKPVPAFELPPLGGVDRPGLATADLTAGRVVLVNFFASWCIPCRAEHPLLMDLAEAGTVAVIGINYRDKPADARRWLAQLGNPYERIGADQGGRTTIDWGVSGVPETFVIDRSGRIRDQHIGPMSRSDLEDKILPLVEELSQ
jgi:cytochrome c biogenesis protein CcmG/thiol:disulfide interchange protein DsbE